MGVVAQEVGSLADFRDRISVRLAGLADDEANEQVVPRFETVGGAAQEDGALSGRARGESGSCAVAYVERGGDLVGACMAGEADNVASVGRVEHRLPRVGFRSAPRKRAPNPSTRA